MEGDRLDFQTWEPLLLECVATICSLSDCAATLLSPKPHEVVLRALPTPTQPGVHAMIYGEAAGLR